MAGPIPILIGAPKPPPQPSKRELLKRRDAALKAAKGHRERAELHTKYAKAKPGTDESADLARMADEHLKVAETYESVAKAAAEAAERAKR